jgi:ABC-2 type transport system permease protein
LWNVCIRTRPPDPDDLVTPNPDEYVLAFVRGHGWRRDVRVFWVLARAGFRRYSTYRLATFAGLVTNTVFGLIRASILLAALAAAGTTIAGYSEAQANSYVWWSQGLVASIGLFGWSEVSDRVRSGDIAVDFARPLDPQVGYLAADLGRAALQGLARGVPSIAIGAVVFGVSPPQSPAVAGLAVVSVLLGVVISFGCRYAVNLTSFWLVQNRGVQLVYMVASGFLAGLFVPVHWFPDWLLLVARCTPFPSMLQAPIDLLSGRASLGEALPILGVQLAWAAGVLALGQLLTRRGRRVLEVQGG